MRLLLPVALLAACSSSPEPAGTVPDAAGDAARDAVLDAAHDTYSSYAHGFFQTYCERCHSPGGDGYRGGELDFTDYSGVVASMAEIRCGVAATRPDGCVGFPPPQQFPIAPPIPTDAERDRIVAWIDVGAPE
jgi:hypothetical protein